MEKLQDKVSPKHKIQRYGFDFDISNPSLLALLFICLPPLQSTTQQITNLHLKKPEINLPPWRNLPHTPPNAVRVVHFVVAKEVMEEPVPVQEKLGNRRIPIGFHTFILFVCENRDKRRDLIDEMLQVDGFMW